MATQEAEGLVERVQRLTDELAEIADPQAQARAQELIGAVLELYGEGLARIVGVLEEGGEPAAPVRRALIEDGVVASLLLIHDLYPVPLHERVSEALDSVRPYMESHGGDVELVSLQDGLLKLRLQGSCHGCLASAATLELALKEALEEAAPDLAGLEVEGVVEPQPRPPAPARLSLPMAGPQAAAGAALPMVHVAAAGAQAPAPGPMPPVRPGWQPLPAVGAPEAGAMTTVAVAGRQLVVARVGERLLAYVDRCGECGASVADGELADGVLTCASCRTGFSLPMAGRAFNGGGASLQPVPLLDDEAGGGIRVALEA